MTEPNYVHCILHSHFDARSRRMTWCRRIVPPGEFYFTSLDHAIYHNLNGGRLIPCAECAHTAINLLNDITAGKFPLYPIPQLNPDPDATDDTLYYRREYFSTQGKLQGEITWPPEDDDETTTPGATDA